MIQHYLRIYPPNHPLGCANVWLWQVCSLNEIEMDGTEPDRAEAITKANAALDVVMEEA